MLRICQRTVAAGLAFALTGTFPSFANADQGPAPLAETTKAPAQHGSPATAPSDPTQESNEAAPSPGSSSESPPATAQSAGGRPTTTSGEPVTPGGPGAPDQSDAPAIPKYAPIEAKLIPAENPNERRQATGELEGARLESIEGTDIPESLPKARRVAWWTLLGGVSMFSASGVFWSRATRHINDAGRLSQTFDPATGQVDQFEQRKSEYELLLLRGRQMTRASQVFLAAGAATTITSLLLFIRGTRKNASSESSKPKSRAAIRQFGPGYVDIRF